MATPRAVAAIIRSAIEDATVSELLHRPGNAAWRAVRALEREGWVITLTPPSSATHKGTQRL
ncbi:hypothetical protein OG864_29840 [Streptomyces sp. NBC_00124]|uniref:hypothetical protein n=1 Tax=Streptomyces sp. NBC_00124 TaxID=2975662 RepID=UPI00225730F2|nr:hypothetical protein [Streptomyces sp. NBC_00124]MCX5362904.1 hypothetical protein [Streptomyces sp. NBC_00124]